MPDTRTVTTLLHLSDTHLFPSPDSSLLGINTWESLKAVVRHIRETGVQAQRVLVTGDLAQDAQPRTYQQFLSAMAPLPWPLHCLPGNHDYPQQLCASLQSAADPIVDCGAWRLVLLDSHLPGSEKGHLAPAQLMRLQQAAQVAPGRHVLVALHHHPIPMQCAWLDTTQMDNAAALFQAIDALPAVRALVWGHVHQALDSRHPLSAPSRPPLRLLTTPSTCFQFLPRSPSFALDEALPGYRLIHLHPNGRIETELIRIPALPPEAGTPEMSSTYY